jgi:DNA-binding response OmpR family regulator
MKQISYLPKGSSLDSCMPYGPVLDTLKDRLRILVVEDNVDLCDLICELLTNFGHDPSPLGSAEDALIYAKDHQFDVLLTDISLPGMSGLDLARRILQIKENALIIFASGYLNDIVANFEFPAHSLTKPYDIEKLQVLLSAAAK